MVDEVSTRNMQVYINSPKYSLERHRFKADIIELQLIKGSAKTLCSQLERVPFSVFFEAPNVWSSSDLI